MEDAVAGDTRRPNAIPERIATGNRYRLKNSLVVAPVRVKAAKAERPRKEAGKEARKARRGKDKRTS